MARTSIFLDRELIFMNDVFLIFRCVKNDTMPRTMNDKGMTKLLIFSSVHKSTKVKNPERTKLVTKDSTKISNFEKYFVSLHIFKKANPDSPDVQTNATMSLTVLSPIRNSFTKIKINEK